MEVLPSQPVQGSADVAWHHGVDGRDAGCVVWHGNRRFLPKLGRHPGGSPMHFLWLKPHALGHRSFGKSVLQLTFWRSDPCLPGLCIRIGRDDFREDGPCDPCGIGLGLCIRVGRRHPFLRVEKPSRIPHPRFIISNATHVLVHYVVGTLGVSELTHGFLGTADVFGHPSAVTRQSERLPIVPHIPQVPTRIELGGWRRELMVVVRSLFRGSLVGGLLRLLIGVFFLLHVNDARQGA